MVLQLVAGCGILCLRTLSQKNNFHHIHHTKFIECSIMYFSKPIERQNKATISFNVKVKTFIISGR